MMDPRLKRDFDCKYSDYFSGIHDDDECVSPAGGEKVPGCFVADVLLASKWGMFSLLIPGSLHAHFFLIAHPSKKV